MAVDPVRELFAVPPKEFTSARDALAKQLRDKGDAEAAKRIAKLRRPTAALWAVNRVARTAPDQVRALLDASEQVRRHQARAVRGGGGDELRAAMAAQRAALADLERRAADALSEAGSPPAQSTLRAVQSTLQAAATGDRRTREQLREGTLEHELAAKGFDALLGAPSLAAVPSDHGGGVRSIDARRTRGSAAPTRQPRAPAPDGAAARREAERARRLEERERKVEQKRAAREEQRRARDERRTARDVAIAATRLQKLEERAQAAEHAAHAAREEAKAARARLEQLRK